MPPLFDETLDRELPELIFDPAWSVVVHGLQGSALQFLELAQRPDAVRRRGHRVENPLDRG